MSNASIHKTLRRIRGELIALSAKAGISDHHVEQLLKIAGDILPIEIAYETKYLREDKEKR